MKIDFSVRRAGFTLVEIVLALGLLSVALVGVFGLLSAASTSSANSARETVLVSMTSHVLNDLRGVRFDLLWKKDPRKAAQETNNRDFAKVLPRIHTEALEETLYYFDSEGVYLKNGKGPEAIYECRVMKKPEQATTIGYSPKGSPSLTTSEINVMGLILKFSYPVSAPEKSRQVSEIYARIARY